MGSMKENCLLSYFVLVHKQYKQERNNHNWLLIKRKNCTIPT